MQRSTVYNRAKYGGVTVVAGGKGFCETRGESQTTSRRTWKGDRFQVMWWEGEDECRGGRPPPGTGNGNKEKKAGEKAGSGIKNDKKGNRLR